MADVYTRIGYIKGDTGAQGAQGAKGDTGDAATIEVGSVTTVPYGQTANVTNSGTESAAIFDFQIPQGRPGEQVTDMQNLTIGAITTSSASFPVPAVGETGKVLWGKVVKWFSDMTALVATKLNAANVVNNLTTTTSGYALDARQGKELNSATMFVKKTVYVQGDVTAGGSATFDLNFGLSNDYTPIGIIHLQNNSGFSIFINGYWWNGNTLRVYNRSFGTATITTVVMATAVFARSTRLQSI